jgi:glucokinase
VYKLLADFTDDSPLRKIAFDQLSAKMITEEAMKGDKIAMEAFEYTGRILGTKLADFIIHTDPEAIFLSGGLAKAGGYIFDPAYRVMEQSVMPIFRGKVKLLPSGLNSQDAAIIGAASLISMHEQAK